MLETTIAGSLPKPSWLADPNKLWPSWRLDGEALAEAKRDATLLGSRSRKTPASTSSPTASSRANISCTGSWQRSPASTSPNASNGHPHRSL